MALDSSWFNPQSQYGQTYYQPNDFSQTPAGNSYYNQNLGAYYDRRTLPFAGGNDPFSTFVRNRQSLFQQGYGAALGTNPNLTTQQYGNGLDLSEGGFRNAFNQQAAQLRGRNDSNYGAGRLRWSPQ